MDTDKIILPGFLVADLYKGCLIDPGTFNNTGETIPAKTLPTETVPTIVLQDKIKYFGENNKNITIIVKEPNAAFLNKEDLDFLANILKACQLNIADIAIVNISNQPISFRAVKEQLLALQLVLFDVAPALIGLPFMIPAFQIQNYAGSTIMLAPPLSVLNKADKESKLLKTKLWNSLKRVFNI